MVHKMELFSLKERKKVFNAFWRAEIKGHSSINLAGSKYKIKKM